MQAPLSRIKVDLIQVSLTELISKLIQLNWTKATSAENEDSKRVNTVY